jgi:hypothetical protein
MMKKLLFGAGLATGFILGSRAGRGSYDRLASVVGRIWRDRTGPAAGPSGRRSAGSAAPADAVRAAPERSDAARDQFGLADAAAHSGQSAAERRVGTDPSTDDRPGSEWSGPRAAGSVEAVGDPEEELGHS